MGATANGAELTMKLQAMVNNVLDVKIVLETAKNVPAWLIEVDYCSKTTHDGCSAVKKIYTILCLAPLN